LGGNGKTVGYRAAVKGHGRWRGRDIGVHEPEVIQIYGARIAKGIINIEVAFGRRGQVGQGGKIG
jgi:hypothetical protein